MSAIGLYFQGLTKAQTNALRTRLNAHAAIHGYVAHRGPTAGRGNLAALLVAIDAGEVATILLSNTEYVQAIAYLESLDTTWSRSIVVSLRLALQHQAEADQDY